MQATPDWKEKGPLREPATFQVLRSLVRSLLHRTGRAEALTLMHAARLKRGALCSFTHKMRYVSAVSNTICAVNILRRCV
jgi:hypothetical protein